MKNGIIFRRFCRGGYAIFASLHREVRIGVLTVGMLASVNIPKVQALQVSAAPDTEEDGDETELAEVSVAGTMAPLAALQSARIVSVITAQQIESSAAQSVNDLLKLAAGVDVRQRGGFGIQTDISINGGTFDQITLLLNGVNISSPHTGHLAADFPVALSDIERIEVLEGAASRVYGASAFGGAINIVTKRPSPTALEAGVSGGSYATFGGDARLSTRLLTLSASYLRSDGATANSDFHRGNVFWRGLYEAQAYSLDCQAGFSRKDYGANTFYSAAYPNQYEQNSRYIFSAAAETKGRVRVRPEVFWNRLLDDFELTRGSAIGKNHHQTDVYGTHVHADLSWAAGRTAFGAEVREEQLRSTSMGDDRRTNLSVNLEHNILLPRLTVSVGVLGNYNTRFDSGLRFYPGIDIAVTPSPHWRLFASYNKGFRLPTFTDLYYKAPTHEGNPNMKAEESHSFQLGARASFQRSACRLQLMAKVFYHRGQDLIDWVMFTPADVFHSSNFDLDNMGLQATASCQLSAVNAQLSYAFLHQRRRDDAAFYKSNYAMEYLRHKLVATLEHPIARRLSASWTLRWQDRRGGYLRYENAQSTGEFVNYRPYATLDVKLRWQAPRYELWAEATNLTNHTYYDLGNIPQPGLLIMGGARVTINN